MATHGVPGLIPRPCCISAFFAGSFVRNNIECTSSQSVSKETFFHPKRSHSLSSSSVLGAGSLYVVLSTIVQMVSRGFTSREFASPSPFAIKFSNPLHTMSACAPLFSLQGFPIFVGHISSYCCTRNFYISLYCKVEFFYLSVL